MWKVCKLPDTDSERKKYRTEKHKKKRIRKKREPPEIQEEIGKKVNEKRKDVESFQTTRNRP